MTGSPAPDARPDDAPSGPRPVRAGTARPRSPAPAWAVATLARCAAILVASAVVWVFFWLLLRIPALTVAVAVSLLLAALLEPATRWQERRGLPRALAALLSILLLLAFLVGVGALMGFRATSTLRDLTGPLTAGIDRIREWLIEGPLGLDPQQVADARDAVVDRIYELVPEPAAATRTVLYLLAGIVLVLFLVFFLLKDGARMWAWVVDRSPEGRRERIDGAGHCAWTVLSSYVRGIVVVALIDAVGIGAALLILGVPLWLSLTLLTFLGAFVPIIGATASGAVAVLVTLVTNGPTDAVIVLVVVLVVQQVEGNLLQPLIVGRTVRLHPAVVLVAVTAGTLLWGLAGALLAVPLLAVTYRVVEYLRETAPRPPDDPGPAPADGERPDPPAADGERPDPPAGDGAVPAVLLPPGAHPSGR